MNNETVYISSLLMFLQVIPNSGLDNTNYYVTALEVKKNKTKSGLKSSVIRAAFSMGLREAVHPFQLLKAPAFPSWSLLSSPSESRSYHLLSSPTSASRTTFACWPPVLSLGPSSQDISTPSHQNLYSRIYNHLDNAG